MPLVPLARNDAGTNASCSRLLVGSVRWTDRQSGRQALDGAETRRFLSHGGAAHGGSLPVSSMGLGLSSYGLPHRTPPPAGGMEDAKVWQLPWLLPLPDSLGSPSPSSFFQRWCSIHLHRPPGPGGGTDDAPSCSSPLE